RPDLESGTRGRRDPRRRPRRDRARRPSSPRRSAERGVIIAHPDRARSRAGLGGEDPAPKHHHYTVEDQVMLAYEIHQPVREIAYRTRGQTGGPITRLVSP